MEGRPTIGPDDAAAAAAGDSAKATDQRRATNSASEFGGRRRFQGRDRAASVDREGRTDDRQVAAVANSQAQVDRMNVEQTDPLAASHNQMRSSSSSGNYAEQTEISLSPSPVSSKSHLQAPTNTTADSYASSAGKNTPISHHHYNRTDQEPLIHTDKLNASSPILYVFPSPRAQSESTGAESGDIQAAASSSFISPSRVAILSAMGKRAADLDVVQERRGGSSARANRYLADGQNAHLVPRLVVLNLEVGSSTANLAWSLTLVPSAKGGGDNPAPLAATGDQTEVDRRRGADEQGEKKTTASEIDEAPSSSSASYLQHTPQVSSLSVVNELANKVNRSTARGGGAVRSLVKRDTIKVVPTLGGRRDESTLPEDLLAASSISNKARNNHRYRKAMNVATNFDSSESDEDAHNEGELPDKRQRIPTSANGTMGGDSLPTTGVRQSIDSSSDLLRIANNSERQRNSTGGAASRPTTIVKTSAEDASSLALQPSDQRPLSGPDLSVGMRLQLSRVQALPANTSNKRPPMRASAPGAPSTASNALAKPVENSPPAPGERQLRSYKSDEVFDSSSITSSTTTTTTTPAPTRSTQSPADNRRTGRPTVGAIFAARRQSLNRLTTVNATTSSTTNTTPAPPQASNGTSRASPRALSPPMIRKASVPLNRIQTPAASSPTEASTSTTTPMPSTTSSPSATREISPIRKATPAYADPKSLSSSPTVGSTSSTTTSTSTTEPPVTLVTEGSSSRTDSTEDAPEIESTPTTTTTTTGKPTSPEETKVGSSTTEKPNSPETTTLRAKQSTTTVESSPQAASSETSTAATEASSTIRPEVVSTSTTRAPQQTRPPAEPVDVSKWLVRLRRFASNEIDIVKVVVNNLKQFAAQQQHHQKPEAALRYIQFKNLEPSSAYEICIESASPNQQVEDRFKILDANHFLKCHDTTDVELSNSTTTQQQADVDNNSSGTSIRRLDLDSVAPSASQSTTSTGSSRGGGQTGPQALPQMQHEESSGFDQQVDQMGQETQQPKMKSLCKEFFTLPANSQDKINYGQFESLDAKLNRIEVAASSVVSRKVKPPPAPIVGSSILETSSNNSSSTNSTTIHQAQSSATTSGGGGSLRRPKSLQNTLKSHMELLEINDMGSSFGGSREPGANMFEILASRSSQPGLSNRISSLASGGSPHQQGPDQRGQNHREQLQERPIGLKPPPTLAPNQEYLTRSVLPIVGCVFALIFLATLANIVLSAIKCKSSSSARRRRALRAESRLGGSPVPRGPTHKHALGSFYSDQSDNSATSQSRIVIVGKSNEPFTGASAYFELPDEARLEEHATELAHSPQGSGSKLSTSSRLLSSASRFPLGPSFEGDERHNADMVGLARKNYDNFINHIYNGDLADGPTSEALHEANSKVKSSRNQEHSPLPGHYHRHFRHQQPNSRDVDPYRLSNSSLRTVARSEGDFSTTSTVNNTNPMNGGQTNTSTANKRQRLRFDKINPIYNMNGLQYATATRIRVRSPMGGVSSFQGHVNRALTPDCDASARQQLAGSSRVQVEGSPGGASGDDCLLCSPNSQQSEQQQQQLELADDDSDCDRREEDHEKGEEDNQPFSCCLDRQKQRFEKQQQQLERVMTRNGSLIPQPFINPIGPPRCASPTCQAVTHDHDLLVAASGASVTSKAESRQEESMVTTQSDKSDSEETLVESSKEEASHTRSNQESETTTAPSAAPEVVDKPRDFFLFGESTLEPPDTPLDLKDPKENETTTTTIKAKLPPPPEPPAMSITAIKPISKSVAESGAKALVKLGTMSSDSGSSTKSRDTANESINKTDFNQRRNELASKLKLAGMSRPPSNSQLAP